MYQQKILILELNLPSFPCMKPYRIIIQCVLSDTEARYNKDVICVIEQDNLPKCETIKTPRRRSDIDTNLPSHEPYLPNARDSIFYNCTTIQCNVIRVESLTQLASPSSTLKYCYLQTTEKHKCVPLRYYYFKNIDKLLFLKNNIKYKSFYLIDCLVYADGGRVCHKKNGADSHTKLVDIGNITRPKEANILSQEEFICEESEDKKINCDHDRYVPYPDGLREKEPVKIDRKILLKVDNTFVNLNYNCIETWCGYSGDLTPTRRLEHYEPPGGKTYRCFYANRQQVCKELYGKSASYYNGRDWLDI